MLANLRRYFAAGLTVFLPLLLTVYLIVITFNFADSLLGNFIRPIFNYFGIDYVRGTSIIIFILFIFLIGFLVTNFLGRRIYPILEKLLLKLPFFRQVYPAMKEIATLLFSRDKLTFKQVVLVEYPRKGIYTLGFFMNNSSPVLQEKTGQEMCNILIPSSPSPFTGFVILVPKSEVIFTDISIESGIKFVVSDGVVNPN